jgi:hypothetical protein
MKIVPRPALLVIAGVAATAATTAATPPQVEPLSFLLGTWATETGGKPGEREGSATFTRELQDRVIVRRSSTYTVPVGDGPSFHHEDLMVVHADAAGALRADFFDSEGHVIRYLVAVPSPGRATFESQAASGVPRYRLSYRLGEDGRLAGSFEIAPADKPGAFAPHLSWSSRREGTAPTP